MSNGTSKQVQRGAALRVALLALAICAAASVDRSGSAAATELYQPVGAWRLTPPA